MINEMAWWTWAFFTIFQFCWFLYVKLSIRKHFFFGSQMSVYALILSGDQLAEFPHQFAHCHLNFCLHSPVHIAWSMNDMNSGIHYSDLLIRTNESSDLDLADSVKWQHQFEQCLLTTLWWRKTLDEMKYSDTYRCAKQLSEL